MILSGIDLTQRTSTGFTQSGTTGRTAEKNDTVQAPKAQGVTLSNTNMMAGHFVHGAKEDSKYISGLMKGLDVEQSFSSQMNSLVTGYKNVGELTAKAKALQGKEMTNADWALLGQQAEDDVKTIVDDEVSDTHEEKLEDIRDDIEEKADEAVTPESEKALENETAPQEALEESLEDGEQAAAEAEAPQAEPSGGATDAVAAAPATPGTEAGTEMPPAQAAPGDTTPIPPSLDLVV